MNVRNDEPTAGEGVDHVSSLFVNFDSVEVTRFSGHLNSVEVSGEFPDPPELDLEFSDDCGIVIEILRCQKGSSGATHTRPSNLPREEQHLDHPLEHNRVVS